MNIKIPNVKEIQEIRDSAKSNSKVQSLLKEIITSIKGAAEKGESSVIMSGVGYLTHPENRVLKIACDHLKVRVILLIVMQGQRWRTVVLVQAQ